MPSTSVYLPEMLRDKVIEHAQDIERSASWVITRAVSEYLTRHAEETGTRYEFDTEESEYGPAIEDGIAKMTEETGLDENHAILTLLAKGLGVV